MKQIPTIFYMVFLLSFTLFSQQTVVKGSVKDLISNQALAQVAVTFEGTLISTQTNALGEFIFPATVPYGEQVLKLTKIGYHTARYPIVVNAGQTLDIQDMILSLDSTDDALFTITLSDDELNDDTSAADNISGLLASSQGIFQRVAAFQFSASFFKVRGLNSENSKVLINGIEMNKVYNGRPQWSNWGGINDVLRNQELTPGLGPSSYNFGGVFVTLDNVEFPTHSIGQSYVDPRDDFDSQKIVQRCSGFSYYNFFLETSVFASFKNEVLTDGGGSISGIVSKTFNGSDLVLVLNTTADVEMNGARCSLVDINEFSVIYEDDFESYANNTTNFGDWTNFKEAGSRAWQIKTTEDPQNFASKTARIGAYSSRDSSNIAWLISPSIGLDGLHDAYLHFQSSNSFSDNSDLELLISTDWDGVETGVLSATWTALPGIIVSDSESFENWIDSSYVDLSAYSEPVNIAFRYTGGGTDRTGTFEIDNFKIYVQN